MKISGSKLLSLNNKYVSKYNFPSNIITAITIVESAGEIYATRFEPAFYKRVETGQLAGFMPSPIPTQATERICRATSFGLMQVLGETARTIGEYDGQFLSELFEPELNIEICSRVLQYYIKKFGVDEGIGKYNGAGQSYLNKVKKVLNNNEHLTYYRDGH